MGAMNVAAEALRRRTFAIISHPDAGKTTLTEKLLLYANAIHLAGSVKARKASRHAVSDWMKMEQERGISITSSVLQFEHLGNALNLLDTPGHADFSEDTYRTLAAVDSAVMLMDHSKGVEPRTLRLFEVCRMRKLPVVTFMNKLDRAGLEPLELLDDVSNQLDLEVAPLNWPVGMGRDFRGVVDLRTREVAVFNAEKHGTEVLQVERRPWEEARDLVGDYLFEKTNEELELVEMAGDSYTDEAFYSGKLSPVFWGSAMTNFGVEFLLEYMARKAAPPMSRDGQEQIQKPGGVEESAEVHVEPTDDRFTGFIFKIQANMNPKHRDRIAFMRVVSGRFERGMQVTIGRSGETLRMAKPHSFLAQERSIVETAFPGDIVGLHDSGKLRVGDTLAAGKPLKFGGIPRFAPEFFGQLLLEDPLKRKALDTGLEQLSHEGVIQLFYRSKDDRQNPYLGAVGILQFEVLKERLKNEYNVKARFESVPMKSARWVGGDPKALEWLEKRRDYRLVYDRNMSPVLLVDNNYAIKFALENAPGLELYDIEPL